jgi:general nucleoside transport system permease protein
MKWNTRILETGKVILRQFSLILFSVGLASVFLWISGYPPFAILSGMWKGLTSDLAGTIRWATPLIIAGLAICISFKAEVFNLGVDGQIYIGAAAAAAVALKIPEGTGQLLSVSTIIIVGMLAAAAFATIPALLKVFFATNEVVSTLLLNFIAIKFVEYLVSGPMQDPTSITKLNASQRIPEWTWIPRLKIFEPSPTNIGIYLAIVAAVVIAFIFFKTKVGYEIKIIGANSNLGIYGGMKPKWITVLVMAISGALGGLIGVIEVAAVQHRLINGLNPGFGFDGIVVSLLANNNPVGIVLSGLFFGNLKNAGITMERVTDVPSAITDVVMAIVILTITANFVIPRLRDILKRRKNAKLISQSNLGIEK